MAHTPSPWYVNGGELIGDSTILATLCWHSGRDAENEADAHLIAAAPDLLEALLAIVSPEHAHYDALKQARAAIAKATGEG